MPPKNLCVPPQSVIAFYGPGSLVRYMYVSTQTKGREYFIEAVKISPLSTSLPIAMTSDVTVATE